MGTRGSRKRKAARGGGHGDGSVSEAKPPRFRPSGDSGSVSKRAGYVEAGTPCLVLPGETSGSARRLFSLADRRVTTVAAPDPAHVILGSSAGWLVTVDKRARMHLVNPVTGEQAALPDVTTMGTIHDDCAGFHYALEIERFMQVRFGGLNPPSRRGLVWEAVGPRSSLTLAATQMLQYFYRKVVLSASPQPGCYAAMLILHRDFGAPAFASADDPVWRLAPSPDAVDDAIHHGGQFYSVTCSGVVQAWKRDAGAGGKMISTPVAPRLALADQDRAAESATPRLTDNYTLCRKYLVAALDGRLMVVVKRSEELWLKWTCSFKVYALDGAAGQWEETDDIGEAALFVGLNNSLCVSTRQHTGLKAGRVYFTGDELEHAVWRTDDRNRYLYNRRGFQRRCIGVYDLKNGTLRKVRTAMEEPSFWPPAAWLTPSTIST